MKKKIPKFKNEDEERAFWSIHNSTEFVDWKKAKRTLLPNLKPSVKTISLRLPKAMLEELKLLANKRDVPYQSLLKIFWQNALKKNLMHTLRHNRGKRGIIPPFGKGRIGGILQKQCCHDFETINTHKRGKHSVSNLLLFIERTPHSQDIFCSNMSVDHRGLKISMPE